MLIILNLDATHFIVINTNAANETNQLPVEPTGNHVN